jgi:hypothetical protein
MVPANAGEPAEIFIFFGELLLVRVSYDLEIFVVLNPLAD